MKRSIRNSFSLLVRILVLFGLSAQAHAQSTSYLNAKESDPRKLGWMAGFPPPPEPGQPSDEASRPSQAVPKARSPRHTPLS